MRHEFLDIVRPLYAELVEKTRQEPACIAYDLFVDKKDPGHFIFIEEWPDRQALDAHCQSEHFRRLVPLINRYQDKDCIVLLMDRFDVDFCSQPAPLCRAHADPGEPQTGG